MPRTSEERSSRRRRHEEDEDIRSSRRERKTQGWGAVAKRQADIAERKAEMENKVRDF